MGETELLITIVIFNTFFLMFIVAVMIYIRKYKLRKKEYLNDIKINNEIHQKELLATQLEIQQATMQQIGRELHDNIGQKLTLVSLYTQQMLYENKVPHVTERIEQVSNIINQSLTDLRSLSKTLTDDHINSKSIITIIQEEVNNMQALKKCNIHFSHNYSSKEMDVSYKNLILRITQEFIQNSLKHSKCRNIFINLHESSEYIWKLQIKDDGIGFNKNNIKSNGIGLTNMANRAKMMGAEFSLDSLENVGTILHIALKK